ncbi:hypothetical protein FOZ63_013450, partial [Perkinsus olseni]
QHELVRPMTGGRGPTFSTTPRWNEVDSRLTRSVSPRIKLRHADRSTPRFSDGRVLSAAEARQRSRMARNDRIRQQTERLEAEACAKALLERQAQWLSACAVVCSLRRLLRLVVWYRKRWLYVLVVVRVQRYMRRWRVRFALRRISSTTKLRLATYLSRYLARVRQRLHERSSRVVAAFLREAAQLRFVTQRVVRYLVCIRRIQGWYRRVMSRAALNFAVERRRVTARLTVRMQTETTSVGRMLYNYDALKDSLESEFVRDLLLRFRDRRLSRWRELRAACRLRDSMKVTDDALMFLGQGRPYEEARRRALSPGRWAAIASVRCSAAEEA